MCPEGQLRGWGFISMPVFPRQMLSSVSKVSSAPAKGFWSIGQLLLSGAEGRVDFLQNFFWVAREELIQSPHVLVKPSLCSPKHSDGWTLKKRINTCHKNDFCFFKKSHLCNTAEAPLQTKSQQHQDSRVSALPASVWEGQIQSLWSLSCLQCFLSQALSFYSPLSLQKQCHIPHNNITRTKQHCPDSLWSGPRQADNMLPIHILWQKQKHSVPRAFKLILSF